MAAPDPDGPRAGFRTIVLIIASALFMEQLDITVLTTALPTMARSFHVSAGAPATLVEKDFI